MTRKRPDDYRPDNPEAAEGINHVRSFGPRRERKEPDMPTPYMEALALQLALYALWLELIGVDPARVLRSAADMLEESK